MFGLKKGWNLCLLFFVAEEQNELSKSMLMEEKLASNSEKGGALDVF